MDIIQSLDRNNKLNHTDREICQYIIDHLESIPQMSSRQLALLTYTNATTILRLSRKLGFKNFNDLKVNIAVELKDIPIKDINILRDESLFSIIDKVSLIEHNIINKTKNMLSIDEFREIVTLLNNVHYVDLFAMDANASMAQYACHTFFSLSKIAHVYPNIDTQFLLSMNIPADHVVFLFSKYGDNKTIIESARLLMRSHVPTIAVTSSPKNVLAKNCSYTLQCGIDEPQKELSELIYGIASKYVFDLIYVSLFSMHYEDSISLKKRYHKLLQEN